MRYSEESAYLYLDQIGFSLGQVPIVHKLTLRLMPGEIACLLGPSGSGKTSVLRAIAGLEMLDQGAIYLQGRVLSRAGYNIPPERRQLGMMFQDLALFPHLTVLDNVAFGLHTLKSAERRTRAHEYLARVDLKGVEKRYPHELSGGQQQRVALARALAPKPKLVLLDEPFSSLDVNLRDHLVLEVREILRKEKATAILVTHDQMEAFSMADHVGLMHQGVLQQWGTPRALYERPVNEFVRDFVERGMRRISPLLTTQVVRFKKTRHQRRVFSGAGCGLFSPR